jgi:hypothetical protein
MSEGVALTRMEVLLAEAERQIALIDRCRPLNTRAELDRLAACWEAADRATAVWTYRPAPDLSVTRRALEQAVRFGPELGPLGVLYAERATELDAEARIVEALGTPSLERLASERFPVDDGDSGVAAARRATAWSALEAPAEEPRVLAEDDGDARSLVRLVGALIGSLKLAARVILVPDLASAAAAGDGVILVRPGVLHSAGAARRIAVHEVIGHVLPRSVARGEVLGLFRVGSAHGADDEEGRALLLEEREGLLGTARRRELGVRHLGALAVRHGADFVELVDLMRGHGFDVRDSLRLAARLARGGGLAREIVYLPSFHRVESALAVDPGLERYLERGRVGVAAARALRAGQLDVEGRDDGDVVGRLVGVARRDIDVGAPAAVGERLGREDEIDAQPVVALEPAGAIVPPGK